MPNPYFQFKKFTIYHDRCAMKVTTDSCFFGAWVAKDLEQDTRKVRTLLDIGSGTGLLSLMIVQKHEFEIDAVEVDKEAAEQSKENIVASPWKERIDIINADIREFRTEKKYNCIVSNPPFYENELSSETQRKNIAHHSEQLTMLQVIKAIKNNLAEGGLFYLLLPFKREKELKQLLTQNYLHLQTSVTLRQSSRHEPFRVIVKGGTAKKRVEESISISVCDQEQQYTEIFADLMRDYYLYL